MVSKASSRLNQKKGTKKLWDVKLLFLNIFYNTRGALSLLSISLHLSSSSSRLERKTRARRRRRRRLLSHIVFYGIYFTSFYSWVATVPPKSGFSRSLPRRFLRRGGQEALGVLGAQILQLGIGGFGDDAFGADGFQEGGVDLFHQAGFERGDVLDRNLI